MYVLLESFNVSDVIKSKKRVNLYVLNGSPLIVLKVITAVLNSWQMSIN